MGSIMPFVPLLLMLLFIALNIPVSFSLILSTLVYFIFINTGMPIEIMVQRMIAGSASFPLLAVPFFVFAGTVIAYSGIADRLMAMAELLTGHMKGGLAQVNVMLTLLMSGVSGSANADAAMQSKMLVPEMIKRGYDKPFSGALTATSAVITVILPPGIGLILYALMAEQSVGRMFLAGYIPGLMLVAAFMITVSILSRKHGYLPNRDRRATGRELWAQFKKSIWALMMPFGLLMGLRMGLFSASEAGAVAAVYTLFIGFFVYKQLKLRDMPKIIRESVQATCSVMLLIVSASAFGFYLSLERIPHTISQFLVGLTDNALLLLFIINIFLLLIGMVIEGTASLIILTPILFPVVTSLGVDPIHFGIIMVLNMTIGGVSPPFGTIMFVTCSIADIRIGDFIKASWPFLLALVTTLMLITLLPFTATFLPNLVFG